jgi:hypothetical protein
MLCQGMSLGEYCLFLALHMLTFKVRTVLVEQAMNLALSLPYHPIRTDVLWTVLETVVEEEASNSVSVISSFLLAISHDFHSCVRSYIYWFKTRSTTTTAQYRSFSPASRDSYRHGAYHPTSSVCSFPTCQIARNTSRCVRNLLSIPFDANSLRQW